jgi:hypothetical protein
MTVFASFEFLGRRDLKAGHQGRDHDRSFGSKAFKRAGDCRVLLTHFTRAGRFVRLNWHRILGAG